MTFSILSWNIWHLNQIEGRNRLDRLLQELKIVIDHYQPDCIALNEVIQIAHNETPPVVAYLQKLGYGYTHCAKMDHMGNYWMSGVVLASRFKLTKRQRHIISKNGSAARQGYPGIDKEIISASVSIPRGFNVRIIVAHPSATIDSVKQHKVGMKSLERLVRSDEYKQNTIVAGDMNEWRFIPGSFRSRVKDAMNSQTGSMFSPTWRHNAHRFTPLRLNLDYIYWCKASGLQLENFKVLSSNISDHQPLLATFTYAGEA